MARNKYPEETVKRIVETAARLFGERGYENTSIQDIIDHLGGLSKGAIYHHFRSKEAILDAVTDQMDPSLVPRIEALIARTDLNGFQKLRAMMEMGGADASQNELFSYGCDMMKNPRILALQLENSMEVVAPRLVLPVIEEGMADGSIPRFDYPLELAEILMLLVNIWVNPMVLRADPDRVERKCRFMQDVMRQLGFQEDLITDEVIARMRELTALYEKNVR